MEPNEENTYKSIKALLDADKEFWNAYGIEDSSKKAFSIE